MDQVVEKDCNLEVGMTASLIKNITYDDEQVFSVLTDKFNGSHFSQELDKRTPYKSQMVHDMITASLIASCLESKLPGPGYLCVRQNINFIDEVCIGDVICVKLTLTDIKELEGLQFLSLEALVMNQNGEIVTKAEIDLKKSN